MSLAEIAKMAGVSTATVSRALNNSPLVREETVKKIREAVEKLGYTPPIARSRSGSRRDRTGKQSLKNSRIAVLTLGQMHHGWMTMPVIGSFVSGVTTAAREFDVDVLLDDMPQATESSRLVKRGDVGGAILLVDSSATRRPEWVKAIEGISQRMPAVWAMGGHANHLHIDHILPDNLGIGRIAANYLADRGCKRVAMVTLTPNWPLTRQRLMMFASTAVDSDMEIGAYLVSDDPAHGRAYAGKVTVLPTIEDVADAIANDGYKPDGLFCPRDHETTQFYTALQQAGVNPEQDLKVISCDNDETQLSLMSPRPATIDINPREVARIAIRRLRSRMRNRLEPPAVINVPPSLVLPSDSAGISFPGAAISGVSNPGVSGPGASDPGASGDVD